MPVNPNLPANPDEPNPRLIRKRLPGEGEPTFGVALIVLCVGIVAMTWIGFLL